MPVLTFPSGRKQYALRRISDGAVLKRNAQYPTIEDGSSIVGLDPDLQYLEMWTDVRPQEDARIWLVTPVETVETIEEEGAPEAEVFRTSWSVTKRPPDDIRNAAKNAESLRNKAQLPDSENIKLLLFSVGMLMKRLDNQTLTQREQTIATKIANRVAAIRKNDTRLAQILAAIDQDETPDLDAGWEDAPVE